jgi:hypothetical protein
MATTQRDAVVGVFDDPRQANQAVAELRRAGFREEQIGLLAHDKRDALQAPPRETGSLVGEGAIAGAVTGAAGGALWAIGTAAALLPPIGPVVAGGLLASVLASAAGGAAVTGLVGALIGLGIPEEEARSYESEFQAGRALVTVRAEGRADEAYAILRHHGAFGRQAVAPPGAAAGI